MFKTLDDQTPEYQKGFLNPSERTADLEMLKPN